MCSGFNSHRSVASPNRPPPVSPWTPLQAQLHLTLRRRQLLEKHQRVLVAVSGGQDSLCLLKLLLDLQPKWGWYLGVAHCNHRWRSDSQANAEHVQALAQGWQLPCYGVTASQIPRTEAAARNWRYQTLGAIAEANGFSAVVTGHTASDRAETLLFNLIRGSGADGLQALTWKRSLIPGVTLVRPLLGLTRSQTAACCQEFALPVWEDATNQDLSYRRNRIRQELIPYLQRQFNPQIEQTLAQTAEILQAEVEYLEAMAGAFLQRAIAPADQNQQGDRRLGLNREILRQAPLAIQRRVIRQFLQQALGIAPEFAQIEKVTALLTAANRCRSDPLGGGWIPEVEGVWLWLKPLPAAKL